MTDIYINSELVPKEEALACVRMLCDDAKQIAGVFHGMNRSAKFRKNWPNEYVFADCNWKSFMEAARTMYAQKMGDPKTKEYDKRRMYIALVLQTMAEQGAEKDTRLQLQPGTQQYEGDKFDNRRIVDKFGPQSNTLKDLLMSTSNRRFDA